MKEKPCGSSHYVAEPLRSVIQIVQGFWQLEKIWGCLKAHPHLSLVSPLLVEINNFIHLKLSTSVLEPSPFHDSFARIYVKNIYAWTKDEFSPKSHLSYLLSLHTCIEVYLLFYVHVIDCNHYLVSLPSLYVVLSVMWSIVSKLQGILHVDVIDSDKVYGRSLNLMFRVQNNFFPFVFIMGSSSSR